MERNAVLKYVIKCCSIIKRNFYMSMMDKLLNFFLPKNVLTRSDFKFTGGSNYTGELVNDKTAMRQSAVYACVRILSNAVASLPIKIYERTLDGDRDLKTDHPLAKILAFKPNEWQTSYEWREQSMLHLLLRGEAVSRVYRDRAGRVREILPIPPDMFDVNLNPGNSDLVYTITYSDGNTETLTKNDVLHIRGLFSDITTPITPIQFHSQTIGLDRAMLKHQESTFGPNAAHPGGIITTENKLNADTADRMMNLFNSKAGGSINARKTLILEEGMKFNALQMNNSDAQFIESRKMSVSDIARIFAVPEPLIGQLDRATFSNAEQASFSFLKFSLMPYLQRFQQALYRDLLGSGQLGRIEIDFDTSKFLQGDNVTTADYLSKLLQNGIMTPNECRGFVGLDKYDDESADQLFIQQNMISVTNMDDVTETSDMTPPEEIEDENVLNFKNQLKELRR
jgi:HK97 family phage portal protein